MSKEKIASKAWDGIRGKQDPKFADLAKPVQFEYIEVAERGGDDSVFGQAVRAVISGKPIESPEEEKPAEDPAPETAEDLVTANKRSELEALAVAEGFKAESVDTYTNKIELAEAIIAKRAEAK